MRGPKGSPVTISVHREGASDLIPITIVRDIIKVKSVRFRMLEDGYGYIRLAQFQDGSAAEFVSAYQKLAKDSKKGELQGLIIDLRNNPGGLLTQAIRVTDIFLKDGVIVYTEGRLASQQQKYFAHDDGDEPEFPIITLINEGSASASEIVAGALQDDGRSLILGQPSFGKGSVQTILPMPQGDALRLTTALYYTKSGRSIQAKGIVPDIKVSAKRYKPPGQEGESRDLPYAKERDLPGALKNPQDAEKEDAKKEDKNSASIGKTTIRIGSREAMNAKLSVLLDADPQLEEAFRLLKTWHVFKGKPPVIEAKDVDGAKKLPDKS